MHFEQIPNMLYSSVHVCGENIRNKYIHWYIGWMNKKKEIHKFTDLSKYSAVSKTFLTYNTFNYMNKKKIPFATICFQQNSAVKYTD